MIDLDQVLPLVLGGAPAVLAGFAWLAFRYRMPPELMAIVATMGLPLAGLWRPELVPYALTPSTWGMLAGLLLLSVVALRTVPVRSTRDVFLLGLLAGALPATVVAAARAPDARTAGRLAVVAAGAAAISPVGGPVQWMLPSAGLGWWLASAPAGALAVAICWKNPALTDAPAPPPAEHVRLRWLVAIFWVGCVLQIAGIPWALSLLAQHPPPRIPDALWAAVAWVVATLVDPWLLADVGSRMRGLGAAGHGFDAAVVGLTIPNLAPLVLAWWASDHRAVLAGLPAVLAALGLALLLV